MLTIAVSLFVYLMILYVYLFISYLNYLEYFKRGYSKLFSFGMIAEGSMGAIIVSKANLFYERLSGIVGLNDFTFYILFFGLPILIIRFLIIQPLARNNLHD